MIETFSSIPFSTSSNSNPPQSLVAQWGTQSKFLLLIDESVEGIDELVEGIDGLIEGIDEPKETAGWRSDARALEQKLSILIQSYKKFGNITIMPYLCVLNSIFI